MGNTNMKETDFFFFFFIKSRCVDTVQKYLQIIPED